jgi:hypothetical protein
MNAKQITGLTFYAESINCHRYAGLILTEFFTQITDEEQLHAWFQQESATDHTTDGSLTVLEGVFNGQHVHLILPNTTFIYVVT